VALEVLAALALAPEELVREAKWDRLFNCLPR
jgi:hypothetical protein